DENLLVARRNFSRLVELISSSRGWSCVRSGSFLVRSISFGLIIQKEIVCRGAIASLGRKNGGRSSATPCRTCSNPRIGTRLAGARPSIFTAQVVRYRIRRYV